MTLGLASNKNRLPAHPSDEANAQAAESDRAISRLPEHFLHFPWPALDTVVEGIAPGEVWFAGAYSGHGKTTFLISALDAWFNQGKRIFYMGLESKPSTLRTQWACMRLGIDAGEALSGKLQKNPDWPIVRKRIMDSIHAQTADDKSTRVYFSPEKFVNAVKLTLAFEQAAELESDVLVIDHVDHLEGSAGGLYENSVQVMKAILALAQDHGIKVLAATQFNNEMIRGNRLGMHLPPTPNAVYMGSHKRQIASGMLGLYKPFKFDITGDELKAFAQGKLEPSQVIEPGVMAVSVMKHRLFGNREGKRVMLRVEKGKVAEMPERDMYSTVDKDGFRRRDL